MDKTKIDQLENILKKFNETKDACSKLYRKLESAKSKTECDELISLYKEMVNNLKFIKEQSRFLDDVDYHMQYFEDTYGCYVCSCGCYYSIGPCGFPDMSSANNCRMCNLPIGYAPKPFNDGGCPRHGMVLREGHLRIFKNQLAKDIQMKKFKNFLFYF